MVLSQRLSEWRQQWLQGILEFLQTFTPQVGQDVFPPFVRDIFVPLYGRSMFALTAIVFYPHTPPTPHLSSPRV